MAKLLKETGPRVNLVANLSSIDDFEVLYTDFTEILYRRGRAKAQLMPIIDHSSKLVVSHALGDADNCQWAWKIDPLWALKNNPPPHFSFVQPRAL
jgi:hypothetical protein